ncbi:hypothetical protein MVEN_00931200 [Mycena venus]|uniref:Uncharacterized protein n=1 Tax=Mycena venus TaxID=2733690 RepID=A0A8H6YA62_9AGAR|nr:hypothetical protein MVEN_00931200 [Mycena venus]
MNTTLPDRKTLHSSDSGAATGPPLRIMLLFLFLIHLSFRNGYAAPVANLLNARVSIDSCDDINDCRKLFDVVWSCLATIFACTWVSVHPNVPSPDQSRPALLWHRLKMMLVGIIAPEIMVGFAARQFLEARTLSNGHMVFSFAWGGFVSSVGYPIVTKRQLRTSPLGPEFLSGIRAVEAADLMDKSKGDVLSKGVALVQGLWFTTQCLARIHQRLSVTELEVATLAFAVVNIFIWLLWWDKPLDVERQIVVGPPKTPGTQPITPTQLPLGVRLASIIAGFPRRHYDPLLSTSVPSFWSLPFSKGRIERIVAFGMTALVGMVFGAIHCGAWNTNFPTVEEKWMWRSCSLVITVIPAVLLLGTLLLFMIDETPVEKTLIGRAVRIISEAMLATAIPVYILARLILIILPLTELRSLPPSAFMDVNWSRYIPHL